MSTQQLDSMATELDRRCPICLDTMDDASHVMPCLHQFCFGCIRRWAESRPTCPLCKRRVESILHSRCARGRSDLCWAWRPPTLLLPFL
uniref:RING-type E3 ubiquitin transferase n=1 Tax=Phasianus colchicus TaxID=9054 RepID=A0A669QN46_PHACC